MDLHHPIFREFPEHREVIRRLKGSDDHFRAATFEAALESGQTLTFVASVEPHPDLDGAQALKDRRRHD